MRRKVCSKVFGNASALAKHKLTHSDERKYVCGMCSKAFKRQDHLNGHMLTHRNKKPYECKAEGCGKSYCDARSLRRHTENHHSALGLASGTASPGPGGSNAGPPGGLSLSPATASDLCRSVMMLMMAKGIELLTDGFRAQVHRNTRAKAAAGVGEDRGSKI
uniref:C2H2-type domain-containing protein n=1 Tax=Anopheles maculatus TaxID=74869 RepID=A0A182T8T6_9DIPT